MTLALIALLLATGKAVAQTNHGSRPTLTADELHNAPRSPGQPAAYVLGKDGRYHAYDPPPRISRGLLIAGGSTLGGSYAASALVGLILIASQAGNNDRVGVPLLIPLVGPYISGADYANLADGIPFLALGTAQVVGLALTIGGAIKYRKSKERARKQGFVVELKQGRCLTVDVAASPRLMGSQLSMSF